MDLITRVKQKNDQLLLRNVVLQQCLCARINTSKFCSFLITFTVTPFIIGAVTQLTLETNSSMSYLLRRAALSGLKFRPPF
jgi:hypothetical protein